MSSTNLSLQEPGRKATMLFDLTSSFPILPSPPPPTFPLPALRSLHRWPRKKVILYWILPLVLHQTWLKCPDIPSDQMREGSRRLLIKWRLSNLRPQTFMFFTDKIEKSYFLTGAFAMTAVSRGESCHLLSLIICQANWNIRAQQHLSHALQGAWRGFFCHHLI